MPRQCTSCKSFVGKAATSCKRCSAPQPVAAAPAPHMFESSPAPSPSAVHEHAALAAVYVQAAANERPPISLSGPLMILAAILLTIVVLHG